jgi:hypothetical protein
MQSAVVAALGPPHPTENRIAFMSQLATATLVLVIE